MSRIEALLFDLGNVFAFHDNEKLFRELAAVFNTTAAGIEQRLDGALWERVNRGHFRGDALRRELVERLGVKIDRALWSELWNCHFTINHAMVKLVEPLAARMPCVLVSNTHDQHIEFLRPKLPVLDRFRGLVLSCEVGALKPEPEIYRRALAVAGVAPDRAVFFDDIAAYVEAAKREGIQGRVFTTAESARRDLAELGVL